ncbi:MAG: hypothetical protein AVO34_04850 [Firmicutes bacterium ML8_F2]|nr:MAG: hypothetical protein AVO34_04850 [Firmicutes bacterium ML8_F2]
MIGTRQFQITARQPKTFNVKIVPTGIAVLKDLPQISVCKPAGYCLGATIAIVKAPIPEMNLLATSKGKLSPRPTSKEPTGTIAKPLSLRVWDHKHRPAPRNRIKISGRGKRLIKAPAWT